MKRIHFLFMLIALVFAACSQAEPTQEVETSIPTDTQQVEDSIAAIEETQEVVKPTPTQEETPEPVDPGWTQYSISTNFNYTQSIDAEDIDKDGDIDIVATSKKDKIAWWRNNGGDPVDWEKFPVTTDFPWAHAVILVDMDQDGWLDVLGVGYTALEIAWWKNSGGEEITWTKHTIESNLFYALEIDTDDFDSDGDIDVVGTSGGEVSWWRNDGGNSIQWTKFGLKKSIAFWPVKVGDLDNDGDIDIVAGSDIAGDIFWWENAPDKTGPDADLFVEHLVTDNFERISGLHLNDVDSDGDLDILGAGTTPNTVAWYRNDGGDPLVWSKQVVDDQFSGAIYVISGDMDGDSDIDIVASAYLGNEVALWLNNGGDPISWEKKIIGTGLDEVQGIALGDFDADGDLDIVVAASKLNDIIWFVNDLQ